MSFIRKYRIGGKIYLAEVESRRVKGKVVQRFIRYVGKQADGKTILSTSISDVSVSEVRLYGPLLVLHHLAQEIGLPEHLGPYANEILSMVYAHCLDYRSLNHMRRWFARTDLSWILQLEQLTEERLVRAMDFLEQTDGEKLQRTIFDSVKQRYHLKASGVIYDVTNTYLYGKKCPFAQFGHDKEGVRGRPLIQIGLAVTLEEGIPLFHKVFDGNISDSRTLHDLITTFASYGLRPGTILCDRGITSQRQGYEKLRLEHDRRSPAYPAPAKILPATTGQGLGSALCQPSGVERNHLLCHHPPLSAGNAAWHLVLVLQPPSADPSARLAPAGNLPGAATLAPGQDHQARSGEILRCPGPSASFGLATSRGV
jgi:hypothetical protein